MICPKCGKVNDDNSPECSQCFYKFRFGYGYHDPAKNDPFIWLRLTKYLGDSRDNLNPIKSFIIKVGLIIIILAMLGPILFISLLPILQHK